MTRRMQAILAAVAAAILFPGGLATGWGLYHSAPDETAREHAAPAQAQADGSIVVERRESTPTPPPAPVQTPRGSTEIRREHLEIQPLKGVVVRSSGAYFQNSPLAPGDRPVQQPGGQEAGNPLDSCECPPVVVDLSLVEQPDRTRRVIAKSNGSILSSYDLPIETPTKTLRALPWAAGLTFSSDRALGGFIDRDLGPFRLGGEVIHSTTTGWSAQARAGIRF